MGSGMGIHSSVWLSSWSAQALQKIGYRSSGFRGCLVAGCRNGSGLLGMIAWMLKKWVGISLSGSMYFFCFMVFVFYLVYDFCMKKGTL